MKIEVNDLVRVRTRKTNGKVRARQIGSVAWICKDGEHFYLNHRGKQKRRRISDVMSIIENKEELITSEPVRIEDNTYKYLILAILFTSLIYLLTIM